MNSLTISEFAEHPNLVTYKKMCLCVCVCCKGIIGWNKTNITTFLAHRRWRRWRTSLFHKIMTNPHFIYVIHMCNRREIIKLIVNDKFHTLFWNTLDGITHTHRSSKCEYWVMKIDCLLARNLQTTDIIISVIGLVVLLFVCFADDL